MRNSGFLKEKFSQLVFICFVAYCINYFVPVIIPDSNIERDKRIHVNAGRIDGAKYIEGEVLVRFKPKVGRYAVDSIAESNLSTVARRYNALTKIDAREYAHLKSKHRTTQQMMQALIKNPQVDVVSPNFFLHVDSTIPDDENFSHLWGLHNTGQMGGPSDIDINAPEAWDITTGSSSVIVGVIDTGIDYNHPDLIPNIWVNPGEVLDGIDNDGNGYIDDIHGINAILPSGDPMDDHSHGTHCAGTIGAVGNNNLGVVGINWNVKLIGAKFLDATGYGTDADAMDCINYLIDLKTTYGQNIVAANASFGGGNYDPVMESAINAMGTAGIVFCAAAGNDWMDNDVTPYYPSSYPCSNIIAVTAVDYMGWQNFNYGATSVDLGAPGVEILSTISAVYYPQAGDIFFDDMESGTDNWVTGGANNSWGITTEQEIFDEPLYPVPSPPHFWSDSPGTPYLPDTDSWLMNASDIDLSGYVGQNLYLGFGSAMLLELGAPVDHGYVEVSGDGGGTWQSLMDFAQYGYYWYIPWYFLIPDSIMTANFRFRFHLVTDFSIEYDGWLIDDVGIGTASYYGYGFKSGTSMATPHVTGAVALLASMHPSETVTERINRILNNVTPLPSLIDTCVTEGMLNLYQAVCLPGIPKNPSPPDAAVDISVNTILDWDNCVGASSYDVYFGTSFPPLFVDNVISSSYDPGTLATNTTYYWRIDAKNVSGITSGSVWQFATSNCLTPSIPANPSPVNDAVDVPLDTDLDWDDSAGADSYDVYFGTFPLPPLVGNVLTSYYNPGALNPGTTYYWRIVAKNTCGDTSGSEWQFTTLLVANSYMLWTHPSNGRISIWTLASNGGFVSGRSYGASGWIATSYFRNSDGTAHLLLTRPAGGQAFLWNLDASGAISGGRGYWVPGWSATSYFRNSDGTAHLLLTKSGQAVVWNLNASGNVVGGRGYSVSGFTAQSYHRNSDGTAHLLLTKIGQAVVWNLNASGNCVGGRGYSATGWTASSYFRNSDGTAHLLWTRDGQAVVWNLNASGNCVGGRGYSATGWTASSYLR